MVLSGLIDRRILVWDIGTGVQDATLAGHDGAVYGLAVHRDRLFSASGDGTIRVWALGAWAALRTVEVCRRGTGMFPRCLVVSGSQLISGSWASGREQSELKVWGLETLELQHTLPQPTGMDVKALLGVEGGGMGGRGQRCGGVGAQGVRQSGHVAADVEGSDCCGGRVVWRGRRSLLQWWAS
jgi:WD40 repeat protein